MLTLGCLNFSFLRFEETQVYFFKKNTGIFKNPIQNTRRNLCKDLFSDQVTFNSFPTFIHSSFNKHAFNVYYLTVSVLCTEKAVFLQFTFQNGKRSSKQQQHNKHGEKK